MFGAREPKAVSLDSAAVTDLVRRRADLDPGRLRDLVELLSGPRNRIHHPDAMAETDALILEAFRRAGWRGWQARFRSLQDPGYLDTGSSSHEGFEVANQAVDGVNLLAIREGENTDETIVVLAHHDTVSDSPGADDNTSGVVALLEVARLLGASRFEKTVMLAAVDLEEVGLRGSEHLAATLAAERNVSAVIVLETLAYTSREPASQLLPGGLGLVYRSQVARIETDAHRGDFATVLYRSDSAHLAARFAGAMEAIRAKTVLLRDPVDLPLLGPLLARFAPFVRDFVRSDHKPFWERGLPAIMITDTANFRNPNYHLPTDTPETLDYDHLTDITAAVATTVEQLARPLTAYK